MRTQLTGSTNLSLSNQTFRNFTNLSSVCTDKKSPDEIRRALLDGIELNDHRAVLTAFERARLIRRIFKSSKDTYFYVANVVSSEKFD
jgi:hypothetical protein